mmetsp:Transcript_3458/g.8616  ORF Transcript_3458/g.8616 Transcript_3458/m.8616 type:complete len:313 (+) Transcript_3458:60-998(+)
MPKPKAKAAFIVNVKAEKAAEVSRPSTVAASGTPNKRKHASTAAGGGARPPASPHNNSGTLLSRVQEKIDATAVKQQEVAQTEPADALAVEANAAATEQDGCSEPLQKKLSVQWTSEGSAQVTALSSLGRLQEQDILCDAALIGGSGKRVPVHSVVLAAQSPALLRRLRDGDRELALGAVSDEAVQIVRHWCYGQLIAQDYKPSSLDVNVEVLQLSSELSLPQLAEVCAWHLASGINTSNVVERMKLCEAYGLPRLHAALVQALIQDKSALALVARSSEVLQQPALMRELLGATAEKARKEASQPAAAPLRA